jgi:hypothetical protein
MRKVGVTGLCARTRSAITEHISVDGAGRALTSGRRGAGLGLLPAHGGLRGQVIGVPKPKVKPCLSE